MELAVAIKPINNAFKLVLSNEHPDFIVVTAVYNNNSHNVVVLLSRLLWRATLLKNQTFLDVEEKKVRLVKYFDWKTSASCIQLFFIPNNDHNDLVCIKTEDLRNALILLKTFN